MENNTELIIGPYKFTYTVQKITLQENKGVEVVPTTRTDRNFIIDNADAQCRAQIQFIFTGIEEINTGVRGLLALFRTCPITTIKNELLSTAWKKPNSTEVIDEDNPEADENINVKTIVHSDYIPVCLDDITISSINDIPYGISLTLNITRIDVDFLNTGGLLYQGEKKFQKSENPQQAFWLNRWLSKIIENNNIIPYLTETDFNQINIKPYVKTLSGLDIQSNPYTNVNASKETISFNENDTKVLSETCRITNSFAYQKLIGKGFPTAQHMGVSSRICSIDLLFDTTSQPNNFQKFCQFKETSDELIRSTNRYDRASGWYLTSPISKLLGVSRYKISEINNGIFVPINITTNTTDEPHLKTVSIDLAESDVDYVNQQDSLLIEGGFEQKYLKHFFTTVVMPGEKRFRDLVISSPLVASTAIIGAGGVPETIADLEMFKLVWPVTKNVTSIDTDELDSILNIDTIRAALLSPKLDLKAVLLNSLKDLDLVNGKILTGAKQPSFIERFRLNLRPYQQSISGPDRSLSEESAKVFYYIKEALNKSFVSDPITEPIIEELSKYIFNGYLGDTSGGTSSILNGTPMMQFIKAIYKNNIVFKDAFKEALFDVIVKRRSPPENLSTLYSVAGLNAAFLKLSIAYITYIDTNPNYETLPLQDSNDSSDKGRHEITNSQKAKRSSVYQDLLLPTYAELYGDDWKDFAPTFSDLGLINWKAVDKITKEDLQDSQSYPAVNGTDIVEPFAWFYRERSKSEILSAAQAGADIANKLKPNLTLSIPFNTQEIEKLKTLLQENAAGKPNVSTETLNEIIRNALIKHKNTNRAAFEQDMETLRKASMSKYADKYLRSDSNTIKLYITNNENFGVANQLTIPGIGGEIYRVANEYKLLNRTEATSADSEFKTLDVDADYRAESDISETRYTRHLEDNTFKAVKSSVDQVPDDKYSAARMFPALKVYLLDKRGNDVIVNDLFFSINGIISVDITQDKDDAELAVIKIADPMYLLQSSIFPTSTVIKANRFDVSSEADEITSYVTSKNNEPTDNILEKYKITQGRPIQIRMGYTSMINNLPIVFTGKIVEISPGDILTIVAQGWKSELINRQVNFYNTDPKNYSAKDLAVMAIQNADPEGFGDYYPQHTADLILQSLESIGDPEQFIRSLSVQQSTTNSKGIDSIPAKIANFILNKAGIRSIDQEDIGLDTRLKNIWYPDTANYNNLFGLRTTFSVLPSYSNDGWIVPIQPAWDVLKEASRQAWNCIVQVVPYDSHSTIFFGHPDQPYYYTRGERSVNKRYRSLISKLASTEKNIILKTTEQFLNSNFYKNPNNKEDLISNLAKLITKFPTNEKKFPNHDKDPLGFFNYGGAFFNPFIEHPYIPDYTSSITFYDAWNGNFIFTDITILNAYRQILEKFSGETPYILLNIFFDINKKEIIYNWPTINSDMETLLSGNEQQLEIILSQIGGIPLVVEDILKNIPYFEQHIKNITFETRFTSIKQQLNSIAYLFYKKDRRAAYSVITSQIRKYAVEKVNELDKNITSLDITVGIDKNIRDGIVRDLTDLLNKLKEATSNLNTASKLGLRTGSSLGERLRDGFGQFKIFIYFFSQFISNNGEELVKEYNKGTYNQLAPNMKVFRVHHWVDSQADIIQNNIVATTSEMWNTVIIEHPDKGSKDDIVDASSDIIQKGSYYSSVKWEYYPKQEVTGVIGLQFHPGMTLANKKVQIFNELNCHTPELSAKLACTHLADGIRRMYRGSLIVKGRVVKPHDRIIIFDAYTNMSGPIEVESVIHHWNSRQGWVTNILPQAVCDVNPGAGIFHTAMLEAAYARVFSAIDFVADAATFLMLGGVLSGAKLALGSKGTVIGGLKSLPGLFTSKRAWERWLVRMQRNTKGLFEGAKDVFPNPINGLRTLNKNFGKLGMAAAKNALLFGTLDQVAHFSFKMSVVSGFVESSKDVNQLPVILSPLTFNGGPFTAGLEMNENIYSIFANNLYYSFADLTKAAGTLMDDFIGTNKVSVIK